MEEQFVLRGFFFETCWANSSGGFVAFFKVESKVLSFLSPCTSLHHYLSFSPIFCLLPAHILSSASLLILPVSMSTPILSVSISIVIYLSRYFLLPRVHCTRNCYVGRCLFFHCHGLLFRIFSWCRNVVFDYSACCSVLVPLCRSVPAPCVPVCDRCLVLYVFLCFVPRFVLRC